ncbi:unnamed protein product [Parajaminaea phylloscopi]
MADTEAAPAVIAGSKRSIEEQSEQEPAQAPSQEQTKSQDRKRQKNESRRRKDNKGVDMRRGTREEGQEREDDGEARLPKRRVAVLFGYCGVGYSGLQVNPGVKTIEGEIFDVFCKAGCVSKDNAVNPNKVGLQRAARTDRGVHAAGNLLNLKLILNPPTVPTGSVSELVKYLNDQLPPLIRIWSINRVQASFNARTSCDSRYYQYLLPTYVFLPPKPHSAMWRMYSRWSDGGIADEQVKQRLQHLLNHPFWKDSQDVAPEASTSEDPAIDEQTSFKKDTARKRTWRLADDDSEYGRQLLPRIRSLWQHFLGTKNFHNYTVGKSPKDPSAKRVMKELDISDPFIVDRTEYVSVTLHGQSFMLHQIRKMVGLLVLVARSPAPELLVNATFQPGKIHVPKAPALGLLLNSPVFEGYNGKVKVYNQQLKKQREAGKVTAEEEEQQYRDEINFKLFKEEMEAFRMQHIYQTQYETEEREDEFAKWLNYLDSIVGPDFEYLNPHGTIPIECHVGGDAKGGSGQPVPKPTEQTEATEATANILGSASHEHEGKQSEEYAESDDEDVYAGKKAEDLEG